MTTYHEDPPEVYAITADPGKLAVVRCTSCPRTFAYQLWPLYADNPHPRDEIRNAFLDGLAEAARTSGMTIYGLLYIDPPATPDDVDPDCQRIEVWRLPDRRQVADTTQRRALQSTTAHACPRRRKKEDQQ